ncbi:MAG: hypothetical protein IPG54_12860 [Sphingomonadales bacterium]|nr:hypothetical protein [Sphingomonadales bacterium]MBK9004574.1 hypothetical protein [Sphingomonadales bacterium]MBK9269763.1 hypothetical protein [Sphingomonadales bacterium]
MNRFRNFAVMLVAVAVLTAGGGAALFAKSRDAARSVDASLTLYSGEGMQGEAVTVKKDIANFQSVQTRQGFDGTANDFAFSLRSIGRWQVCMDAGYRTDCLTVDGEMASLGERGGSISSARYIGPSLKKQAGTTPSGPASDGPAQTADWQPMYNVDLFGNDYRTITYDRPGQDWRSCKAACDGDRQCRAWTFVQPGRTDHGECFLKSPVPEAAESDCCISGIKGAASSKARTTSAPVTPSFVGHVYDTNFNDLTITSWTAAAVTGRYEYYGGRIEATFSGDTLTGYWLQETSPLTCGTARSGTQHWGRFTFVFNADRSAFTGKWGDCDDAPSQPWEGSLIRKAAAGGDVGSGSATPASQSAVPGVVRRIGDRAGDAAERSVGDEVERRVDKALGKLLGSD